MKMQKYNLDTKENSHHHLWKEGHNISDNANAIASDITTDSELNAMAQWGHLQEVVDNQVQWLDSGFHWWKSFFAPKKKNSSWLIDKPLAPQSWEEGQFVSSQGILDYQIYVSEKAAQSLKEGKNKVSLMLCLHGCKQTAKSFAIGAQLKETAEKMGTIVLCPEQSRTRNPLGCWNWFRAGNQTREHGESALLEDFTSQAQERFGIESDRTFVMGLSAGGAQAVTLACLYPQTYGACAVHSGLAFKGARNVANAMALMKGHGTAQGYGPEVPTLIFQGSADLTVHPSNAEKILGLRPQTEEMLVEHCVINGRSVKISRLRQTARHPEAEIWLIEEAGHAWSGGNATEKYVDEKGPHATLIAWEFFENHAQKKQRLVA